MLGRGMLSPSSCGTTEENKMMGIIFTVVMA